MSAYTWLKDCRSRPRRGPLQRAIYCLKWAEQVFIDLQTRPLTHTALDQDEMIRLRPNRRLAKSPAPALYPPTC